MDFFVSYTQRDRAWAEWIAWELEANGYSTVIQAWDFTPGSDWAHMMQDALKQAQRVIAVLSSHYLTSAHGEAEWLAAYAADPRGDRGKLVPVRVDECEPPGLLNTRVYVDLVGLDEDAVQASLVRGVAGGRAKPANRPAFPTRSHPNFPGADRPAGEAEHQSVAGRETYSVADLFNEDPVRMVAAAESLARSPRVDLTAVIDHGAAGRFASEYAPRTRPARRGSAVQVLDEDHGELPGRVSQTGIVEVKDAEPAVPRAGSDTSGVGTPRSMARRCYPVHFTNGVGAFSLWPRAHSRRVNHARWKSSGTNSSCVPPPL